MQIRINLLLASLLISGSLIAQLPVGAQHVTRHADGTVDVGDDESPAPVTHGGGRRGGSSGRIPAYTRRMGGVTVKRHADGTVDIVDDVTPYHHTSTGGGGHSSSHRKAMHHHQSHKTTHSSSSAKKKK